MAKQRKTYSAEFKQQAVRLATEPGQSIAKVARDLGVSENMLSRWKKQRAMQGEQAFPGQGKPHFFSNQSECKCAMTPPIFGCAEIILSRVKYGVEQKVENKIPPYEWHLASISTQQREEIRLKWERPSQYRHHCRKPWLLKSAQHCGRTKG